MKPQISPLTHEVHLKAIDDTTKTDFVAPTPKSGSLRGFNVSEKPRVVDFYHSIALHPFFWVFPNTEVPVAEGLPALGDDVPTLYDIYRNDFHVVLETAGAGKSDSVYDGDVVIAYLLDQRFIVVQSLDDYHYQRMNLLASKMANYNAFEKWWYYRDMLDTNRGRQFLNNKGLCRLRKTTT